ncbi:MAG: ArnT family glycosyltransferase [Planctomycetota bacterium]
MNLFKSLKKEKPILWSIALMALGIRLAFLIYFEPYIISTDNITIMAGVDQGWAFGFEAGRIAKSIASGTGFSSPLPFESGPTAWLMPGYPLLLAFIFKLFGIYTQNAAIAAFVFNCLFSALACVPIYYIAKKLFGGNVGMITAGVLALYPPSVWHAINTIWDTTIYAFLALVLVAWLLSIPENLNHKNALLFGLFMGFVALFNASIIAFYPVIVLWLLAQPKPSLQEKLRSITIICIIAIAVLSPWLYRNYTVLGKPMLRSNFGLEFKLGNNLEAWEAFVSRDGRLVPFWKMGHPSIDESEFERFVSLGELSYMDQCFDQAISFIKDHPEKFMRLTLRRIVVFWISELRGKNEWTGKLKVSFPVSQLKKILYNLPIPFMIIGIILGIKKRQKILPLLGLISLFPIVYYLTHVNERYRYPVEPFILVFACYGFYFLMHLFIKRVSARFSQKDTLATIRNSPSGRE